jgi:hypothetical protein
MAQQYYAAFGIDGGQYELVPCSSRDEARKLARDKLGPLLKSTDDDNVFACIYAGAPGAASLEGLEQVEELWRGGE